MDLLSIAKILLPLAPTAASIVGGLIGGPAGAVAASGLTKIIMGKFGLSGVDATPEKLSERIAEAGEETARAKINASMMQARAEIEGFVAVERAVLEAQVKNLADVNATIRGETEARVKLALAGLKDHWFFSGWRPAFAWVFIAVWGFFGLMLTVVTGVAVVRSPDPFALLKDAWPLFASYFGPGAAVLGVLIPSRSYEKGKAMETPIAASEPKSVLPTKQASITMPPVKPTVGQRLPLSREEGSGVG